MTPDPLADLRDWHPPDPVSWWPPAPGWWLLSLLVLLAIGLAIHWWSGRRRETALVRAAARRIDALARQLEKDGDARRYVAELSALLRRLALRRYPRERVAGLSGAAWLEFLDATGGEGGFAQGVGRVLVEIAYRPAGAGDIDPEPLRELVMGWVRANREPPS